MEHHTFDLIVVGGGSGGVRAARIAAGHGARVAIVEEYRYGGTCVIRGCVPKKLLTYAAEYAGHHADAVGFGWKAVESQHDWTVLREAKEREITRLEGIYQRLLNNAGVTTFSARGTLASANVVDVGSARLQAETILIATGATPVMPPVPGAELMRSSNEVFDLPAMPRRVVVLGGGYIACEFASIFAGLGASVIQAHRGEQLLRGFDGDVRLQLAAGLRARGIELRLRAQVKAAERVANQTRVHFEDGSFVDADVVLAATGRRPNTRGLGLEALGVGLDQSGAVRVDEASCSTVSNIYAVGDVTNRMNLTPVAIREGHAFADTVYGGRPRRAEHRIVATAVFSQPQVATVGLSEEEARAQLTVVRVYRTQFRPMRATLSGRNEQVLMKLIVDDASDRVVGVHMVGGDAAETVQALAIAMRAGATKADFDETVGIHPTAAEEFVTMREPVHA